jgi:hypothetical protein
VADELITPAPTPDATTPTSAPIQPAAPAQPPAWDDIVAAPEWKNTSPQERVAVFDRWHADALQHASNDPQWQSFKDEFTQNADAVRKGLLQQAAPESHQFQLENINGNPTWSRTPSTTPATLGPKQEEISATPSHPLSTAWEKVKEAFSPIFGPTQEQLSRESIPVTKPDGSIKYEYRPAGSLLEQRGLIPALSDYIMTAGNIANLPREASLLAQGKDVTPANLEQVKQQERQAVGLEAKPGDSTGFAVTKAVANTLLNAAETIGNPAFLSLPQSRILSTGFSIQMLNSFKDQVQQIKDQPTLQGKIETALGAATDLLFAGWAGKHAAEGRLPEQIAQLRHSIDLEKKGLPETAKADDAVAAQKETPAVTEKPAEVISTTEPHPDEQMTAAGERLAPEVALGAPPESRIIPALLNPDGTVLESGKEGETHADITRRAAQTALDAGDTAKVKQILQASNTDSQHGFVANGEPMDRVAAGKLADETGQRSEDLKGQPLQSQHLQEAALANEGLTMKRNPFLNSTHKALGVTDEEMTKGLPAQTLMQRMVSNPMATAGQRALAEVLAKFDTGTKVTSERTPRNASGELVHGSYKLISNTIKLDSNLFHNDARETALHEAWHAIDYWTQQNPKTPAAFEYAAEVKRIHELAMAHPDAKNFAYELQLVDGKPLEMIPSLANDQFFSFMNHVLDPNGKSLFSRILEAIQKFLGVRTGSLAHTALEKVLQLKPEDVRVPKSVAVRSALAPREGSSVKNATAQLGAKPEDRAEDRQLMQDIAAHMAIDDPQRIVTKGAELVLEQGARKYSDWKAAMEKEFGAGFIASRKTWEAVQDLLQSYNEAKTGKARPIKSQIEEATGLRESTDIMQKNMADAISRSQALTAHLSALEKGGKAGRARTAAEMKTADRWLAGDQARVRQDLVAYVNKNLPPEERGRFINRITQVLRRQDIQSDNPGLMYYKAKNVMQAIQWRAEDVYADSLRKEIRDLNDTLLSSGAVGVEFKQAIRDRLKDLAVRQPTPTSAGRLRSIAAKLYEQGKGIPSALQEKLESLTKTSLKDLSVEELEAIRDDVKLFGDMGKEAWKSVKEARAAEQRSREADLVKQDTTPRENWEKMARDATVEDWQKIKDQIWNATAASGNWVGIHEKARMFMPHLFELLDGKEDGWLTRNVLKPFYTAYRGYLADHNPVKEEAIKIANEEKLSRNDFLRLGIHFHLGQEGTLEEALKYSTDKAAITKMFEDYQKNGLTKGQQRMANFMRANLDAERDPLVEFFAQHYNKELKFYDNYFPRMMDTRKTPTWRAQRDEWVNPVTKQKININDVAEMMAHITDIQARSRSINKGFAEARKEGAEIPLNLNAMEVFLKHNDDVSYVRNVQPVLNMAGTIANTPLFSAKYGQVGKGLLLDYIDALAKRGQYAKNNFEKALDGVKNRAMVGLLGFRLSQFKHLANYPLGFAEAGGPQWWGRGWLMAHSPEGRAFIEQNFPEILRGNAGDVTIQEASEMGTTSRASFVIDRVLDYNNRASVALGKYLQQLDAAGHDWMSWDKTPIDQEMLNNSRIAYVKSVGSVEVADRPLIVTKGTSVGSKSLGTALMAYQSPKMIRWGTLRTTLANDLYRNKQYGVAASKLAALTTSSMIESAVKYGSKAAYVMAAAGLLGLLGFRATRKPEDNVAAEIAGEAAADFLSNPPGGSTVGEAIAAAKYPYFRRDILGKTGVPPVDFIISAKQDAGDFIANQNATNSFKLLGDVATLSGAPLSIPLAVAKSAVQQAKGTATSSKKNKGVGGKLSGASLGQKIQ